MDGLMDWARQDRHGQNSGPGTGKGIRCVSVEGVTSGPVVDQAVLIHVDDISDRF